MTTTCTNMTLECVNDPSAGSPSETLLRLLLLLSDEFHFSSKDMFCKAGVESWPHASVQHQTIAPEQPISGKLRSPYHRQPRHVTFCFHASHAGDAVKVCRDGFGKQFSLRSCALCSATAQTRTSTKRAGREGSHKSDAEWHVKRSSKINVKPPRVSANPEAQVTCRGKLSSSKKVTDSLFQCAQHRHDCHNDINKFARHRVERAAESGDRTFRNKDNLSKKIFVAKTIKNSSSQCNECRHEFHYGTKILTRHCVNRADDNRDRRLE